MGSHACAGVATRAALLKSSDSTFLFGDRMHSWALRIGYEDEDEDEDEDRDNSDVNICADYNTPFEVRLRLIGGRRLTASVSLVASHLQEFALGDIPKGSEVYMVASATLCDCEVGVRRCDDHGIDVPMGFGAQTLARLHADRVFSDATLVAEDAAIPVHRAIVASASPVLRAMLESTFQEGHEARIQLTGTSQQTAQAFVAFLYGQPLPDRVGAVELLQVAHYYQVQPLLAACVDRIAAAETSELVAGLRCAKRFSDAHEDAAMHQVQKRLRKAWDDAYRTGSDEDRCKMLEHAGL